MSTVTNSSSRTSSSSTDSRNSSNASSSSRSHSSSDSSRSSNGNSSVRNSSTTSSNSSSSSQVRSESGSATSASPAGNSSSETSSAIRDSIRVSLEARAERTRLPDSGHTFDLPSALISNFSDLAGTAVPDAGRNGRESAGEVVPSADSAAVSGVDKVGGESSVNGVRPNSKKSEAKQATETAANEKVASKNEETAQQAASGEVTVRQGDSVWSSLRAAGYSNQEITSQGLVDKVAQASGLRNADQIKPGDVLKLPARDGAAGNGSDRKLSTQDVQADGKLGEAVEAAAAEAGLPEGAVPGVGSAAKSEHVEGSNDMRTGTLTLRDPKTGEVLGTYEFNNGGSGRGSIPDGTYEVSDGRRRSDKAGMMVDGYGYSFALTEQGMASGTADDPRYSAERTDLRIHPDGRNPGTAGCIGIVGDAEVQREFYENAQRLAEANGGSFMLEFG